METLLLIVAFWLILLGVYGALFLPRGQGRRAEPLTAASLPRRPMINPAAVPARPRQVAVGTVPSAADAAFSEVDFLRSQVEQLRHEILAMSETPPRSERGTRRPAAATAVLPRPLQRQVRERRSTRRVVRA